MVLLLAAEYGVSCGAVDPVNNCGFFFSFLFFSIFIFALPILQPWRFGAASFFAAVPQFPLRRRVVSGGLLVGCTTPLPPNPEAHWVVAALLRRTAPRSSDSQAPMRAVSLRNRNLPGGPIRGRQGCMGTGIGKSGSFLGVMETLPPPQSRVIFWHYYYSCHAK